MVTCPHNRSRVLTYRMKGGEAVEICHDCEAVFISTPTSLRTVYPMTMIPEVRVFLQEIVDNEWLLPNSDRRHREAARLLEKYA